MFYMNNVLHSKKRYKLVCPVCKYVAWLKLMGIVSSTILSTTGHRIGNNLFYNWSMILLPTLPMTMDSSTSPNFRCTSWWQVRLWRFSDMRLSFKITALTYGCLHVPPLVCLQLANFSKLGPSWVQNDGPSSFQFHIHHIFVPWWEIFPVSAWTTGSMRTSVPLPCLHFGYYTDFVQYGGLLLLLMFRCLCSSIS